LLALVACASDGEQSDALGTMPSASTTGPVTTVSSAAPAPDPNSSPAASDAASAVATPSAVPSASSAATASATSPSVTSASTVPAVPAAPAAGAAGVNEPAAGGSSAQSSAGAGGQLGAAGAVAVAGGSNGTGMGGTSGGGASQAGAAASPAGSAGDGSVGGSATQPVDQSTLPGVTLHLAGDSTVMTYEPSSAQEGWGQELGQFFIDKLSIDNQAIGGASIRTFQTGRWLNITSALEAGDYVMIQFGTNDSGTVQGRHVDVSDFKVALNEMVDDVESKQATAIFVTPSALQEWSGDTEGNTRLGPYADAMLEVGPMRDVLVDDLNARGVELLNMIGKTAAQEIYIDGDKAHFTKMGATQMAEFVANELVRIESPLSAYLAPQ
jgi:lysophospholipase L1-like esterase